MLHTTKSHANLPTATSIKITQDHQTVVKTLTHENQILHKKLLDQIKSCNYHEQELSDALLQLKTSDLAKTQY